MMEESISELDEGQGIPLDQVEQSEQGQYHRESQNRSEQSSSHLEDFNQSQSESQSQTIGSYWVTSKFETYRDENQQKRRKCIHPDCSTSYAFKTSHTKLHDHYRKKHGVVTKGSFLLNDTPSIDSVMRFIIMEQLEYTILDSEHFKKMIKSCGGQIPKIDRKALSQSIIDHVEPLSNVIKKVLSTCVSCSLTFDLWTNKSFTKSYAAVTCHFVDENMKMRNFLLEFTYVPYPHTGLVIADTIEEIITRYSIKEKLLSITTDNASNNILAFDQLKVRNGVAAEFKFETFHLRCLSHILHLAVGDAIRSMKDLVTGVRNLVDSIKGSPKRTQTFEDIQKMLQPNIRPLKLVADVSTRWNSTYLMLRRVLKLKEPISKALLNMPDLRNIEIDWEQLEEILDFLKPMHDMTVKFSEQNQNPISLIAPILPHLSQEMSKSAYTNKDIKKAADDFLKKISLYDGKLYNDITEMAAILDPRIKSSFLQVSSSLDAKIDASNKISKHLTITGESSSRSTRDGTSIFEKIYRSKDTNEIERYLSDSLELGETKVLDYWRANEKNYPGLFKLARIVFCAQATSVASERSFSSASEIDTAKRNKLSEESFRANMLLRSWLPFIEEGIPTSK